MPINTESTLDKLLATKAEYSASNYRNPFLATAMVNLNMIDTEVIELDKKQKTEMLNKPIKATEKVTNDPKSDLKTIKWPEKCQIIYDAIKENQNITIPELEKLCDTGHTTVKKILNEMQNEGYIKHEGAPNGGHWEVIS